MKTWANTFSVRASNAWSINNVFLHWSTLTSHGLNTCNVTHFNLNLSKMSTSIKILLNGDVLHWQKYHCFFFKGNSLTFWDISLFAFLLRVGWRDCYPFLSKMSNYSFKEQVWSDGSITCVLHLKTLMAINILVNNS